MRTSAISPCACQVFKTENGHAERSLPPDAPERQLLNGAAEEMVSELRHCAGFAHHTDSVLLMEGGEAAKVGDACDDLLVGCLALGSFMGSAAVDDRLGGHGRQRGAS